MAIIYGDGKAGQYAKRRAVQYFARMMWWSLGGALVGGVVLGFLLATELGRHFGLFQWVSEHAWPFVALAAGITALVLWGLRRLDGYIEKLARERIKWLRGGQGEALVAWYLNDLPNTWHVFHNVELWKSGDLDHVLIGPGGFFCISTKSHRGLYSVRTDGTYLLNGQETDEVHDAQRLALKLKYRLESNDCPVPWIQPVLLAPLAYIGFQTFQSKAWVLHEGNLNEVFLDAPPKLEEL